MTARKAPAKSAKVPHPLPPPEPVKPFLSAGMAADLELHGSTVDPQTGQAITTADLPGYGH